MASELENGRFGTRLNEKDRSQASGSGFVSNPE